VGESGEGRVRAHLCLCLSVSASVDCGDRNNDNLRKSLISI
jgi:hypothetical protein